MWILPRQLHTSPFVPATEALISDLNEQSQACAQSLLVRSKPSPARTWSLKWKRDSWTQLLSGRILKPSHGPSFTAAWTSSVAAIRASHSAQPASDLAPKTQDTSGRLWQPELLQCDQVAVSLKTSRDISALGFPTCCKTWQEWVTERRGAWRQRVNAAPRLTSGKGSSSWPTMRMGSNERGAYYDKTGKGQRYLSDAVVDEQKNWPTVCASEVRQGFQDRSRGMKGSQESLTTAVVKDAANWPTPQAQDTQRTPEAYAAAKEKRGGKMFLSLNIAAQLHGQAAPASSSSLGSRQGLSWATPNACDHKGATSPEACKKWEHRGQNLPEMVVAQWLTPKVPPGGGQATRTTDGGGLRKLEDQTEARATGKLNPRWVETLMGLPIGWTMPSCTSPQTIAPMSCGSLAMESCLPPQSEPSAFSLASWPSPRLNENQQTEELGLLWAENGFKQPKTRGGKARANGSTFDVTLETAARGVAAMEAKP